MSYERANDTRKEIESCTDEYQWVIDDDYSNFVDFSPTQTLD
jgi:hypothetical protein